MVYVVYKASMCYLFMSCKYQVPVYQHMHSGKLNVGNRPLPQIVCTQHKISFSDLSDSLLTPSRSSMKISRPSISYNTPEHVHT